MVRLISALMTMLLPLASYADGPWRPKHPRLPATSVEIVNEGAIPVHVTEPLLAEVVNSVEPPAWVTRTVLRDANGAVVGTVARAGVHPNFGTQVLLDVDGRQVALGASAAGLQSAILDPNLSEYMESGDCSGAGLPAPLFTGPFDAYAAGILTETTVAYSDVTAMSTFDAYSVLLSRPEEFCRRALSFVWWEPPDRCCLASFRRDQVGAPFLEVQIPAFVPPFRIAEELVPATRWPAATE